jgi:hypothetical protein
MGAAGLGVKRSFIHARTFINEICVSVVYIFVRANDIACFLIHTLKIVKRNIQVS